MQCTGIIGISFIIMTFLFDLESFSIVCEYFIIDSLSLNGFPSVVAIVTSCPFFFFNFAYNQSNPESPLQSEI